MAKATDDLANAADGANYRTDSDEALAAPQRNLPNIDLFDQLTDLPSVKVQTALVVHDHRIGRALLSDDLEVIENIGIERPIDFNRQDREPDEFNGYTDRGNPIPHFHYIFFGPTQELEKYCIDQLASRWHPCA
ncbi:hypothetical protein [Bradyrhizobium elkanii]|uniref:hypothetical protein n=1 Tax=Bradyrhizobium elkanii TaxID=29448 RepID=UPI00159F2B5A|nr:hypothetical protein [Bradyrhizobium elkanii]